MTLIVGITGGIGSGKSTLSKEIVKQGFKVHDSDKEVANIYKNPTKKFINHLVSIGLGGSIRKNNINKK